MFIFLYKNEQLENLCSITKMIIMQKNQHQPSTTAKRMNTKT